MCYSSVDFSRYLIISSSLIVLDVMLDNTPWLVNMPRGYSRPEGAVPSHHRSYLFIVFEFRSASLILNPHNSNHVIRPKPKTYHYHQVPLYGPKNQKRVKISQNF